MPRFLPCFQRKIPKATEKEKRKDTQLGKQSLEDSKDEVWSYIRSNIKAMQGLQKSG